jgi:hypothetical protein
MRRTGDVLSNVSLITDPRVHAEDPAPDADRWRHEMEDDEFPVETFQAAQAGAVAHLETMSEAAREAAQLVLMASDPMSRGARSDAARLSHVAEQCDALGVLIGMLDLPAPEGDG